MCTLRPPPSSISSASWHCTDSPPGWPISSSPYSPGADVVVRFRPDGSAWPGAGHRRAPPQVRTPPVAATSGSAAGPYGSVPEVQAVQVRAVPPAVPPLGQVHGEIHVAAEGPEAGRVEPLDGVHVAGYRADGEVLMASGDGLGHDPVDQLPSHPAAARAFGHHDGFDLSA